MFDLKHWKKEEKKKTTKKKKEERQIQKYFSNWKRLKERRGKKEEI